MAYTLLFFVLCSSATLAFVLESRNLAVGAVGALVLQVGVDVAVGVVAYRRAMGRPWPKVAPLPDDDDD